MLVDSVLYLSFIYRALVARMHGLLLVTSATIMVRFPTLEIAWGLLRTFPKEMLKRIPEISRRRRSRDSTRGANEGSSLPPRLALALARVWSRAHGMAARLDPSTC